MSLTDIIYEALGSLPGARFAGVVGTDGLGIEMAYADDDDAHDLELADLELATLTANASAASSRIGSGWVRTITVETEDLTYLASMITPGYFAVLGLLADGNLGKARFTVTQMVERMKAEL
jgi:predicted regulator of Ras-like GTPase activity (Roadblock/LC7/MglB family)